MKECKFIISENSVFVIQPLNWLEGWNRQRWLERYFGDKKDIKNVSFEYWEELRKKNKTYSLNEDNGNFKVSVLENPERLIIKIANALWSM